MVTIRRPLMVFAAACLSLTPRPAASQGAPPSARRVAFDPFEGVAAQYHFDLGRLFFATPAAAAADRARLLVALDAFSQAADGRTWTADALLATMVRADSLTGAVSRHRAYLSLRMALDTRDTDAPAALDSLDGATGGAMGWLTPALAAIDSTTLARFAASRPALRPYGFAVATARRAQAHALPDAEARVLGTLEPNVTAWQARLFQTILASTPYPLIPTPDGPRDVRRDGNALRASPDRALRMATFRVSREALASRRDLYAFALSRTVDARNASARLRGYPSYPVQTYDERYLTAEEVRTTLAQLAGIAAVNRRYESAQIAWVQRVAGVDTVHTWDPGAPAPGGSAPRFTITEAAQTILAATAPLGPEYVHEMAALLDPTHGRLDLVTRPGRVDRPGFSTGSVGYPSTFFQGRFEGYLPDLIILAHEGGHAVQNMLMTRAGVHPLYAAGPAYFTESFAGLNELLVTDYLYRTATDPTRKLTYLRQWLDQATEIFKTAREAAFEQAIYDSSLAGRPVTTADGFEAVMQRAGAPYSLWFGDSATAGAKSGPARGPATVSAPFGERSMEWVNALHFFTLPLYRVNYAYSKLLALAYFDRLTHEPAQFTTAYNALLRNGYDAPPDALLQRFVGVGLSSPSLVQGAARVIDERVTEFERLVNR